MLNAPTETTAAPRVTSRQPLSRDAKQPPSGFSTLVDENAASKQDSSRARVARDADAPQRSSAPEKPRAKPVSADRRTDIDPAAPADDAAIPAPTVASKIDQAADDPVNAKTTGGKPDADKSATPAADAALANVISIVATPDAQPILAVPVEPAAVAIPIVTPPIAAAQIPQTANQPPSAPLAIAAAGIAAAKAAGAETADTASGATGQTRTADASRAALAPDQIATAVAAAPADAAVAAPPVAGAAATKTDALIATDAAATPGDSGLVKPGSSEAAPVDAAAGTATAIAPDAKKADASPADATVKPAPADPDATALTAGPKPPHEQRANPSSAPAIDAATTIVAPAAHSTTHTPAAVSPTAQLTATVATAAPVPLNGLAVELASRAQSGASRFDIRLDPADLGRIDVRIDIDRHGQVTSHLTVEKPETLAMLRQDSPQLQRALNDAGLKTPDGGLQFSLGDQSQPRQNASGGEQQSQRFIIRDDETIPPTAPVRGYGRMLAARSGVDISV